MQQVAGTNNQTMNVNRRAHPRDAKVGMADDAATSEVLKTQSADLRNVANGAIAYQSDRPEALEDRRHHLTAMRSVIGIPADLLQHDHRRFRRGDDGPI